jgi:CRISPR/Cas system-associated exonuclease Cas4 (RecB family)
MPHLLSKSKYIRGLQCERALWLDVHNPRLARYTAEQMRRFDRGREFEYSFKATFPDGIDLSAELKRNVDLYPERTAQLLDGTGEMVLFEAGFQYDDVLVLADVVRRNADGTLDIFEVKSGTELSDTYRSDAAVQYYVISHCRKVNSFSIVYNGSSDQSDQFRTIPLTEQLRAEADTVAANIAAMKEIIRNGEPDTPTGRHCLEPYACPYQHYCAQGVRQLSLF